MYLIPSLIILWLMGVTPVGTWSASLVGKWLDLPEWQAYVSLCVCLLMLILLINWVWRAFHDSSLDACAEDEILSTGMGRGHMRLHMMLLPATLAVCGAAVLIVPADLHLRLLVTGLALFATSLTEPLIRISKAWPPELAGYEPQKNLPVPAPPPEEGEAPGKLLREYEWHAANSLTWMGSKGQPYKIALLLDEARYEQFRALPRDEASKDKNPYSGLGKFVTKGITPEVLECAARLANKAREANLPPLDFINFVVAFTRGAIPYAYDQDTHQQAEYANYPIETLVEKKGDCEDHAILAAALLRELGFRPVLIVLEFKNDATAHAALALPADIQLPFEPLRLEQDGQCYYYCEATPAGDWYIGEMPREYRENLKKVYPIYICAEQI